MKRLRFTLVLVLVVSGAVSVFAQTPSKTYPETRKLLVKMERADEDKILRKLFEQAEVRKSDLIQALNRKVFLGSGV